MEDKEYCIKFIINELKKGLKFDKKIIEEIDEEKKAIYTVQIEGVNANYRGTIIIKEDEKDKK